MPAGSWQGDPPLLGLTLPWNEAGEWGKKAVSRFGHTRVFLFYRLHVPAASCAQHGPRLTSTTILLNVLQRYEESAGNIRYYLLGDGIIGGYPCPKVKNHVIPPEESRDPERAESRYTWKGSRDPLEERGSSEKSPSPTL